MIRNLILATLLLAAIGLAYLAAIGLNHAVQTASADGNVFESHNPSNAHEIQYGYSIVADNHYRQNGNYDIQFDGNTCFRWLTDWLPVVVAYPKIITYTDSIDDFDILEIIACEA
tara:strand:+ start:1035 stop:1379 length:345 start_codon:yes stop_codon:yes gene_type:complete